jgi:alpha/beta superfamily hydrolase
MLAVIHALHKMGGNVLSFDFRAHGTSEGHMVTIGVEEAWDLRQAVSYVHHSLDPASSIVLLGYSMGASTAILAAEQDQSVAGVIADSPYDSLERYLAEDLPGLARAPPHAFPEPLLRSIPARTGWN